VKGIGDEETTTGIPDAHDRLLSRLQLQSLNNWRICSTLKWALSQRSIPEACSIPPERKRQEPHRFAVRGNPGLDAGRLRYCRWSAAEGAATERM